MKTFLPNTSLLWFRDSVQGLGFVNGWLETEQFTTIARVLKTVWFEFLFKLSLKLMCILSSCSDSCKFLHDRSDYKHGWQLEREMDEGRYGHNGQSSFLQFPCLYIDTMVSHHSQYLCLCADTMASHHLQYLCLYTDTIVIHHLRCLSVCWQNDQSSFTVPVSIHWCNGQSLFAVPMSVYQHNGQLSFALPAFIC